jgi:hypothetical protein
MEQKEKDLIDKKIIVFECGLKSNENLWPGFY